MEAVHGLNQGLVDGVVEPDRWTLARGDGALLDHHRAERREMMAPADDGVRLVDLPGDLAGTAPLAAEEVPVVYGLARRAEGHFAAPQDVEWTLRRGELFALQSRPITTLAGEAGDGRAQYLSLRRSFENLERLRRRIEDEDLPQMTAAADRLAAVRLEELDDAGLLAALNARKYAHDRAVDVYVADFVPFAHGVRLFGAAYNDALHPDDPYEFTDLLTATPMLSLRRNAALEHIAACLRDGEEAAALRAAEAFVAEFGEAGDLRGGSEVLALASRLAARAAPVAPARAPGDRARRARTRPRGRAASSRRTRRRSASERRPCSTSLAPAGGSATTTTSTSTACGGCWTRRWPRRSAAACLWTTPGGRGR